MKKRKNIFEFIILGIAVLIVFASILSDFYVINIPDIFILRFNDKEGLFYTLFGIQATISALSISIIAIVTGVISESYYGISITRYITELRSKLFKQKHIIAFSLVLMFINYICVAYSLFNTSIALFLTSIVVTLILIKQIYVVFQGKEQMKKEIYNFFLNNYNKDLLDGLNNELNNAIETGNTIIINQNFDILKETFRLEVENNDYNKTEIIDKICLIISDSFIKISKQHNSERTNKCLLFICDIYKIANSNENKILHLSIWDYINTHFFRAVEDITFEQYSDDFVFIKLHEQLIQNSQQIELEKLKLSSIQYYYSNLYKIISTKKNELELHEKEKIVNGIYDSVKYSLNKDSFQDNPINYVKVSEICNLHKEFIDNGEYKVVNEKFFNNFWYERHEKYNSLIAILTIMYLYYIFIQEECVYGTDLQKNAKLVAEEIKYDFIDYFFDIDLISLIKEYKIFIYNLMHNWEYKIVGVFKTLVYENVLTDFFVFTAMYRYYKEEELLEFINELEPNSTFSLYKEYFGKEDYLEKTIKEFSSFFNITNDEVLNKVPLLKDVLNVKYKQEVINKGEIDKITDQMKKDLSDKVLNECKLITKEKFCDLQIKSDKSTCKKSVREEVLCYTIDILYFKEDNWYMLIKEELERYIMDLFFRTIKDHIKGKKFKHSYTKKQVEFIEVIENLKGDINPNIVFGNVGKFYNESVNDLLVKYMEDKKKISYKKCFKNFIVLDKDLIELDISNFNVEFDDLTWDDIQNNYCKVEEGILYYNVTNDIWIPFDKESLESYINKTKKKMCVYADVTVKIKKDIIGAGMCIVFEHD